MSRSQHDLTIIAVVLLCGAGMARAVALVRSFPAKDRGPSPESIADLSGALVENASDLQTKMADASVRKVERLRYDESAAVLLTCGDDGKPGQADLDDNLDRIVDNTLEMGATQSDDRCLAPWDDLYDQALMQNGTIPISRGTFVRGEKESGQAVDVRFLLHGQTGKHDWTWIVVP